MVSSLEADRGPRRGDWPQNPVIYQIYPRSFRDTSGTGVGDLAGVIERLDHVARLGADAIWLSPFFVSPMCDAGYDVANMREVDPLFGTMAEFDVLVDRAHELGLLVMIDQVFNHTSDQHPWFEKSLAREDGFEDFYVWADPRPDGAPPSNWIGYFGHPAWKWHPRRGQYCLHQFLPCQPGLNHSNPDVLDCLAEITRFWRGRGVDGFRYDAVTSFFYDPEFRDNPPAEELSERIPGPPNNPFTMQRHVNDMLPKNCGKFTESIRDWTGEDAYLIGEINKGPNSMEVLGEFTRPHRLDAGYVTDLAERGLTGKVLADMVDRMETPGALLWWLSTHDQKRQVSRAGDGSAHDAKMLAALLLGLPGPVLLYQGEELGMQQADLAREALHDPFDRTYWPDVPGRDGARTPMTWNDGVNHGFSEGAPWLPVLCPPDGPASTQWAKPDSVLHFYTRALACRRELGLDRADIEVMDSDKDFFCARLTRPQECAVLLTANLGHDMRDCPTSDGHVWLESASQPEPGRIAPRSTSWWLLD